MRSKSTARKMIIISRLWKITEAIWSMICKNVAKKTDLNSCPVKEMEAMTDMSQSYGKAYRR